MCALSFAIAMASCYIYAPVRKEVQEKGLDADVGVRFVWHLFSNAHIVQGLLTTLLTFIMGFYNSNVFSRWWKLRVLCGIVSGALVDTSVFVAVYVNEPNGNPERLLWYRRSLINLLSLAQRLHIRQAKRVNDTNFDRILELELVDKRSTMHTLISRGEVSMNDALAWFMDLFCECVQDGHVRPGMKMEALRAIQIDVSKARGAAADVPMYLEETSMPSAYRHLVEMMVTFYVLITPVGLVHQMFWTAPLVAPVVTLFFYGLHKLTNDILMDPFHGDNKFDTDAFVDGVYSTMQRLLENANVGNELKGLSKFSSAPPAVEETPKSYILRQRK
jgi:predicted membrane chloride channel (bestrophin family)